MAEIAFDLTTDEGRKAFYEHIEKFDYDAAVAAARLRRKKARVKRHKNRVRKSILQSAEFIRASNNHPLKFDLNKFEEMWAEMIKDDPVLCSP